MTFVSRGRPFVGPCRVTTIQINSDYRYYSASFGGLNGSAIPTVDAGGNSGFPTLGGGICMGFRYTNSFLTTMLSVYVPGANDASIPSYSHVVVDGTAYVLPGHSFSAGVRTYNIQSNPYSIGIGTRSVEFLSVFPKATVTSVFNVGVDVYGFMSPQVDWGSSPGTLRGMVANPVTIAGYFGMACKTAVAGGVLFISEYNGPIDGWAYYIQINVATPTMPGGVDAGAGFLSTLSFNGGAPVARSSSVVSGVWRNFTFTIAAMPDIYQQTTLEFT